MVAPMVSVRVSGAEGLQLGRPAWTELALVPERVRSPPDGDAVNPPAPEVAVHRTARPPAAAGWRPSSRDLVWPAGIVSAPLGTEYPSAGIRPTPNDGGLRAGSDPHVGSGCDERPKVRVPPVEMIVEGSQGWSQDVPVSARGSTPDAQVGVALAGRGRRPSGCGRRGWRPRRPAHGSRAPSESGSVSETSGTAGWPGPGRPSPGSPGTGRWPPRRTMTRAPPGRRCPARSPGCRSRAVVDVPATTPCVRDGAPK